jgi:hypothetical protein
MFLAKTVPGSEINSLHIFLKPFIYYNSRPCLTSLALVRCNTRFFRSRQNLLLENLGAPATTYSVEAQATRSL